MKFAMSAEKLLLSLRLRLSSELQCSVPEHHDHLLKIFSEILILCIVCFAENIEIGLDIPRYICECFYN